MAAGRTYTPELASVPEIESLHKALHVDRVVIVQPTLYGTDNACTIDAVRQLGERARGVAVIEDRTTEAELDEMDSAGIRGIRINLETLGLTDPAFARERFQLAVQQVSHRKGWHIQVYTRVPVIQEIQDLLSSCPVPVALDHFAGMQAATAMEEEGFELVLDLLRAGHIYVKLSAPYLASRLAPDYPDITPLARALVGARPDRILWGSNWPHPNAARVPSRKPTDIAPLRQVDDGHIINLLPLWVPDETDRQAILADNPARLYGFEPA
jgi:predicted TIM-barrel fold metal-dependent hydrolase